MTDQVLTQLDSLRKLIEEHEPLRAFFSYQLFTPIQGINVVKKLSQSWELSSLVRNFICFLVEKRRLNYFGLIVEWFHRLYEKRHSIVRGHVTSSYPLSEQQVDALTRVLSQKLNQ